MIELELLPAAERRAPTNPWPTLLAGERWPLAHQLWTAERLASHPLVVNTYPTGTGKTLGALLRLLARREAQTLLIAPTNELLKQHARDAHDFVERAALRHVVQEVDASTVGQLIAGSGLRRGEQLHRWLQDSRLLEGGSEQRPWLWVTNPDIFHAMVFLRYNRLDRRNLFKDILGRFEYLIVDEFHYYNAKQLANFLFFLTLWAELGYFGQGGREVCLLSATPTAQVRVYLERLRVPVAYVSPEEEPLEAAGWSQTPSLSRMRLRVYTQDDYAGLEALLRAERRAIAERLEAGEHGAAIASALWRINLIHDELRRAGLGGRVSRLTGPEPPEARRVAQGAGLILATRTVDLGYNFARPDQTRQGLDFLYADARFPDELVQRLGRAGRVLGRLVTGRPSNAAVIVHDSLYERLRPLAGREVTRRELGERLAELPPRNHLFHYIQTDALWENFRPIYELRGMTSREDEDRLRDLFERLKTVYAPHSRKSYGQVKAAMRAYLERTALFRDPTANRAQIVVSAVEGFLADWQKYKGPATPEVVERFRAAARAGERKVSERLLAWAEERQRVDAERFTFRAAFEPPRVWLYDPGHALTSTDTCAYDLLHVLQNLDVELCADAREWARRSSQPPAEGAAELFGIIRGLRPPEARLRLRFHLAVGESRDEWEWWHCYLACALKGLEIHPRIGQIARPAIDALAHQSVVSLVIPQTGPVWHALRKLSRDSDVYAQPLTVAFLEDGSQAEYDLVLGTAALLARAELDGAIRRHLGQRQRDDPIVV